jgi:tripartite-type tricarboxylate transporter receptor subunit TctC
VATVKDLVAMAKAKPGSFNFSSAGVGSASHMNGELFASAAGVGAVHVPFKGIPEALTEIVTGRIQFFFAPQVNALPQIKDRRMVAIAVSTAKRTAMLPDVPSIAEAGVPGAVFDPWFGFLAPATTPRPIVVQLNKDIRAIVAVPETRDRLLLMGAEPTQFTPEQFNAFIKGEIAKNIALVKAAKIAVE